MCDNRRQAIYSYDNEQDNLPNGVAELLQIPGNDQCMECQSTDVQWVSINLGVFLCEFCSGRHRQLGTHISRVKSLKLDTRVWTEPLIKELKHKGNTVAKLYFESQVPLYQIKPPEDLGPMVCEDWIRCKYEYKLFIDPNPANHELTIYHTDNMGYSNWSWGDRDDRKSQHSSQHSRDSRGHSVSPRTPSLKHRQSYSYNADIVPILPDQGSSQMDFALFKMPAAPHHGILRYIPPDQDIDSGTYQSKMQFFVLHGRFLSRYNNASSQKAEQMVDITHTPIWISQSQRNKRCILSVGEEKSPQIHDEDNKQMLIEFAEYSDMKQWVEMIRRSTLYYKDLGTFPI